MSGLFLLQHRHLHRKSAKIISIIFFSYFSPVAHQLKNYNRRNFHTLANGILLRRIFVFTFLTGFFVILHFKFITELVKELELEDKISALPQGYDTQISSITDGETRFWIGLIRATLSNCRILMIYEYPEKVTPSFHTTLQKIIEKSDPQKRTLILFTHKDDYDSLADMVFKIQNGKIKIGKPFKKNIKNPNIKQKITKQNL